MFERHETRPFEVLPGVRYVEQLMSLLQIQPVLGIETWKIENWCRLHIEPVLWDCLGQEQSGRYFRSVPRADFNLKHPITGLYVPVSTSRTSTVTGTECVVYDSCKVGAV